MNRFLGKTVTAAVLALALGPTAGQAQAPSAVGVVTTLAGEATVARAALAQPAPVKFRDPVFARDRISTGEKSIVRVLLGGKALVTARELSVLTISETPLRSTVTLDAGKVAASVIKARMQPGEIIEFRTPNAVAVVRGTVLIVEVSEGPAPAHGGPAPVSTTVSVVNGLVDVFALATPSAAPARVGGHESVRVTDDRVGTVRTLSQDEVKVLTADMEVTPGQQQAQTRELPLGLRRSIGATEQVKAATVAGLLAPVTKTTTSTTALVDRTVAGTDNLLETVDLALLEATLPVLSNTSKLLGTVVGTVQTTTDALGNTVGGATTTVTGAVGGTTTAVGGTVSGATGALGGVTSTPTGTLVGVTTGVTSGGTGTLSGVTTGITSGVTGTLSGVTTGVTSTGVTSTVTGVTTGVTSGLGRLLKP